MYKRQVVDSAPMGAKGCRRTRSWELPCKTFLSICSPINLSVVVETRVNCGNEYTFYNYGNEYTVRFTIVGMNIRYVLQL